MTITYDCADAASRNAGIAAATSALRSGRLVVMPTDTLYGLACDAFDPDAVAALLAAKKRGPEMPVPVLVGSWNTIDGLVMATPPEARELIAAFWPGALSLVVQQAPSLTWNLGHGNGTVMLRMPLHPVALDVIAEVGPLAVSSANVSGQPPATTVVDAQAQLGESASVYLDGGSCPVGQASTIIDLTSPMPLILREGAISADRVAEVLGCSLETLRPPPQ